MNKIIPILPCDNIKTLVNFYSNLGFECTKIYTQPNAYAVLRYEDIEIHFFGNKKFIPSENPSMCVLQVDDVDKICEEFTAGLKMAYGKVPRTGIPKITKVRDLVDDRRFTLTDTGGNTIYVITSNKKDYEVVFRSLYNNEYAKDFYILYDALYSKEDKKVAANMLSKLIHIKDNLEDCDKAKFLLVEIEILGISEGSSSINLLKQLIENNKGKNGFWKDVENRYIQLFKVE